MISPARVFFSLAVVSGLLSLATPAAAADDRMEWQFFDANDPDRKETPAATLVYGVPETDNVQVHGMCDAGAGKAVKSASVTFGADLGDLENGKDVTLRFSGGGFDHALHGQIVRATEDEGLSGVRADIAHDDPLWTAMAEKASLDYLVPGYKAATLDLERGKDNIQNFVQACRSLAEPGAKIAEPPAGSDDSREKSAFESAKELGTVEAWDAFLANYPSGFHADLARAYVKKLGTGETAAPPESAPRGLAAAVIAAPAPPDPSCQDQRTLRSLASDTPAKITFVNRSGMYRSVLWLDFNGQPKDYANLNPGEEVTLDTFVTHPWLITNGPGDCIQIVMPHADARIAELTPAEGVKAVAPATLAPPKPKAAKPAPPKKATPKAAKGCGKGQIKLEGRCMAKSQAAGFCGPGYRPQGGRCVQGAYPQTKPSVNSQAKKKGCKPGEVWNAQEGCHWDD